MSSFRCKYLLGLLLWLCALTTLAQPPHANPQDILQDILEQMATTQDETYNPETLAQDIMMLLENPIDINNATHHDLERIFFLSHFQVVSLIDYINQHGPMLTKYELSYVYGFNRELSEQLRPFIIIDPSDVRSDSKLSLRHARHNLFIRSRSLLQTPEGYSPAPPDRPNATRYAGGKLGMYTRYSVTTPSGIQAGFVGTKNPGEEILTGSNPYGFDHNSFHLQLDNLGYLQTVVVGDFNADFGQGLTLWTGSSFGKGMDPLNVRKRPKGLYRSSSTDENRYLRGSGATVRLGSYALSVFGSYKYIDANIADTLPDGQLTYTSLPNSGLHRTPTEISSKNQLAESVVGGNATYTSGRLRGGLTAAAVNVQGVPEPTSQAYRMFDPPLSQRVNVGMDLNYALRNHLLYAEAAHTLGHGSGVLAGGVFRLHPLFSLSLLGRSYQKDYSSHYAKPFADVTSPSGERGLFTGFTMLPYGRWELKGYADIFEYSWLRFGVAAPSYGHDYMLEANWKSTEPYSINIRYRQKQKESNLTVDTLQTRSVIPYNRQSARVQLSYNPISSIELRTRIEHAWYNQQQLNTEHGTMIYQDVRYKVSRIPLVLTGRFAIFETDSWNTRIYAYENDVLYSFSIPAYYSQGTRTYIMAQYSVGSRVDIWVRLAQTYFANQASIGSGLERIEGSSRTEVKAQVRIKL